MVVALFVAAAMGASSDASPGDREAALRANVARLSEEADDPSAVASALAAIRRELRGAPEGPARVVQPRGCREILQPRINNSGLWLCGALVSTTAALD